MPQQPLAWGIVHQIFSYLPHYRILLYLQRVARPRIACSGKQGTIITIIQSGLET